MTTGQGHLGDSSSLGRPYEASRCVTLVIQNLGQGPEGCQKKAKPCATTLLPHNEPGRLTGNPVEMEPSIAGARQIAECRQCGLVPVRNRSGRPVAICSMLGNEVARATAAFFIHRGGTQLISTWQREARRELVVRRGRTAAWSYRSDHALSVEPTVMACLALDASGDEHTAQSDVAICKESARWLAALQRTDGSLPVSAGLGSPVGWPTAHGVLLWSMLDGYQAEASRARDWLLARKGNAVSAEQYATRVLGHDPRLVGWPWVESTHSWLEPTALTIVALCRLGLVGNAASHGRRRADPRSRTRLRRLELR